MSTIDSLSSLSAKTGIGGLVSGMDIDELVKSLTATSRNKVTKQQQKVQKLEWKQTAYRSVITALKEFQGKYLDILSPTNFRSPSFFNTVKATSSSSAVSVSSTQSTLEGTITINEITQLATKQTLKSSSPVSKPLTGTFGAVDETFLNSISGKTISIELDGKLKTITFDNDFINSVNGEPINPTEESFKNAFQAVINKAFGLNEASPIIDVSVSGGKISFTATGSQVVIRAIGDDTQTLTNLGLTNGQSNVQLNTTSLEKLSLNTTLDTHDTYKFTINSVDFEFKKTDSLLTVLNKVNSSNAGVTLSYSTITDKFTMVAKEEGTGENIVISEQQGNLLTAFGLTTGAEKTEGKNAILTVNDQVIIRSSNSINIDGVKIDLLNTTEAGADPIKITMEADADSLLEPIKKFVEDYNSMMDLINGLTKEKAYSDYEPLTEEQKEEMTEEQIKKWEDKAKSGILRSDRILNSITSKLQSIIYGSAVEGGISLYNLGITSAGYNENGKLKIDETKLKEALASKSIEIRELFTSDEGIGNKMNDIILGAIKTSGVKGSRGTLVEVAGVLATTSDTENNISKSIERTNKVIETLQKKLTAEETRMWSRFTAMEKALQQLNAQSMMLSQFSPNSNY